MIWEAGLKAEGGEQQLFPIRPTIVFHVDRRRSGGIPVERLPIFYASAQEFGPGRNRYLGRDALWKQRRELRVVPTEIVSTTIPVRANPCAQALHLSNELLPVHPQKIVIHG